MMCPACKKVKLVGRFKKEGRCSRCKKVQSQQLNADQKLRDIRIEKEQKRLRNSSEYIRTGFEQVAELGNQMFDDLPDDSVRKVFVSEAQKRRICSPDECVQALKWLHVTCEEKPYSNDPIWREGTVLEFAARKGVPRTEDMHKRVKAYNPGITESDAAQKAVSLMQSELDHDVKELVRACEYYVDENRVGYTLKELCDLETNLVARINEGLSAKAKGKLSRDEIVLKGDIEVHVHLDVAVYYAKQMGLIN